jgi:hypothetical protein
MHVALHRTQDGGSGLLGPAEATFEPDWPSCLPANNCIITDTICLADHSPLPKKVVHNMGSGRTMLFDITGTSLA